MVKKRGILLRIITGTVMLILVVVSALVQTEPAAAADSGNRQWIISVFPIIRYCQH